MAPSSHMATVVALSTLNSGGQRKKLTTHCPTVPTSSRHTLRQRWQTQHGGASRPPVSRARRSDSPHSALLMASSPSAALTSTSLPHSLTPHSSFVWPSTLFSSLPLSPSSSLCPSLPPSSMPRLLLVVTSASPVLYSDGQHTGVFWSEAVDPYDVFTAAGWQVDVASETGHARIDQHSVSEAMLEYSKAADSWHDQSHPMHGILSSGVKAGVDVRAADYDAVYYSAGYGALYDYPTAHHVASVGVQLYEAGKPVAAVCHAAVIFAATVNAAGQSIAKGKRVTGFTRSAEKLMGVDEKMAADGVKDCEAIAQQVGALWDEPADPWADYTIADGHLLTGVNPASGTSLARNLLRAVQAAA